MRCAPLLTLLALAAPLTASAQSVGTAFSGPATSDGASAFYNPAAMAAAEGSLIELDGGLAILGLEYAPMIAVPPSSTGALGPLLTLGAVTDAVHPDWRLGLTVAVPRTSGGSWDRDDAAAQITRYYLVGGTAFHIQAQLAASWTPIEWLTIGLGANLAYGSIASDLDADFGARLNQTAMSEDLNSPFPYGHPDLAAPVTVEGGGVGVGGILGVLVEPIEELSIGVSVHTPVIIDGGGTIAIVYPQRLQDFVADTAPDAVLPQLNGAFNVDLSTPTIVTAGLSGRPHEMVELAANYTFEHTSSQPNLNLRITERSYESVTDNTSVRGYLDRHRVFARVAVQPIAELRVAAYGSYQSNTIPDELLAPNNIDFDRIEIGLALRVRVARELSLMAQYSHLFLLDRNVETSLHRPVTQASLAAFNHPSPTGSYTARADTIRVGLTVHFDSPHAVDEDEAGAHVGDEEEGADPSSEPAAQEQQTEAEHEQTEADPASGEPGAGDAAPAAAVEGEAEAL